MLFIRMINLLRQIFRQPAGKAGHSGKDPGRPPDFRRRGRSGRRVGGRGRRHEGDVAVWYGLGPAGPVAGPVRRQAGPSAEGMCPSGCDGTTSRPATRAGRILLQTDATRNRQVTAPRPSATSDSRALLVVAVAIGGGLAAAFHMGKIPGALPAVQAEFSLDLLQSGLVVSSFSILSAVFGTTLGFLTRRTGARLAGTLGLAATAAGAAMGTVAVGFPLLLTSRVLEGLGFLLVAVTMPGLINRACPPHLRPLALGVWAAFIPAAMSLMLLASPMVLEASGWRGLWWLSAVVSLVLAFSFFTLAGGSGEKARTAAVVRLHRRDLGTPLLVSGIFSCYSALFAAVTAFLPTYWSAERGLALEPATYLASLVVIGNIAGNITAGYLVGRGVTLERLMRWALLGGGGASALVFSGLIPLPGEFAAAWMFTFLAGMLPGAVFAHVGAIAPSRDSVPLITGMIFQGAGIGQVLGPVGIGMAAGAGLGWPGGAGFLLFVCLLGTWLCGRLVPRDAD